MKFNMETQLNEKVREKTNFLKDVESYGKIAESALVNILSKSSKTKTVIDLSSDPYFRDFDIDFAQVKEDDINKEVILKELQLCKKIDENRVTLYECKTDTFAAKSRNIVYEDISNGNSGCLARSKAHYLFYVFVDKNNEIIESYLISIRELRKWLMRNFDKINRYYYLQSRFMARGEDNTAIFLINIDWLLENENFVKKI